MRGLTYLDISKNNLGENGAHILSVTGCLTQLRYLNIIHNRIGEVGCKCIAESESFPMLSELVIYPGNNINSEAKKVIHRSKKLRSLNHIE